MVVILVQDQKDAGSLRAGLGDTCPVLIDAGGIPGDSKVVAIGSGAWLRDARATYRVRPGIDVESLLVLCTALEDGVSVPGLPAVTDADQAHRVKYALEMSRQLAFADGLSTAEAIAAQCVTALVAADRAYCLFHDADDGSIWSESQLRSAGDDRRAGSGIVGYVALTGRSARVAAVGSDPRWDASIDDPVGDGRCRLLAQPVVAPDRVVHGVLVAVRGGRRPAFDPEDSEKLHSFAALATPLFRRAEVQSEADSVLASTRSGGLFSPEAVEGQSAAAWGDVMRISPRWISRSYWWLLVGAGCGIAAAAMTPVRMNSSGPAVIRAIDRSVVVSETGGTVVEVALRPGDRIQVGDVLARLEGIPGIRATRAGIVADSSLRVGQYIRPGEVVATIVDVQGPFEMVGLLPDRDRPRLSVGMPIRLDLSGHPASHLTLVVEAISPHILTPLEACRVLSGGGGECAFGAGAGGHAVFVRARLPDEFRVGGRALPYVDGMIGRLKVPIRSARLLDVLIASFRGT